jgi:DNA adenine methylase
LNRGGFNGLYRENRHGGFNVPMGSYARITLPEPAAFWEVSRLLQGVEIVTAEFGDVLARAQEGDQVYCDPPYVPLSATANFTAYCKEPFGPSQQQDLADAAREAAARGVRVVLSNHDLPTVIDHLYAEARGFEHVARPRVARAISRNGADRKAVAEVIAAIGPKGRVRAA